MIQTSRKIAHILWVNGEATECIGLIQMLNNTNTIKLDLPFPFILISIFSYSGGHNLPLLFSPRLKHFANKLANESALFDLNPIVYYAKPFVLAA
jgi:hypothetical protein